MAGTASPSQKRKFASSPLLLKSNRVLFDRDAGGGSRPQHHKRKCWHPDQSVREGPQRRVSRAESCLAGSASPNLEGCMEGDTFPLAAGQWYKFRELECHLGNVGSRQHSACYAPAKVAIRLCLCSCEQLRQAWSSVSHRKPNDRRWRK
jgi:hypothetical protein